MTSESISPELARELERLRREVHERLEAACGTSETATLTTGRLLNQILADARGQVDELAALGAQVSDGDDASVSRIARETSNDMRTFMDALTARLAEQTAALHRATDAMKSILRVGDRIENIATASRFLALNAVVEASRLGDVGAASRVIAQEMKDLSASVEAANGEIGDLARALSTTLPAVAATAIELNGEVSAFRGQFDDRLTSLDAAFASLRLAAQSSVSQSKVRLANVVSASHEALSQLQFQDPMAQALRRIDGDVTDTIKRMSSASAATGAGSRLPVADDVDIAPAESTMDGGELALF